ncbi:hypothetical protein BGZ83_006752 [Gryganskiella cystojenkinii]|nr:hypothetical protein BGZ83_006752 [Gryganskiella cystojenkinii]
MDMDVDNMDTAFLKSWSEVLRRTDPLLWSLAMDSQPLSGPVSSSVSSAPFNCNAIHSQALFPSDFDHQLLPTQSKLLTSSYPGSHSHSHAKGSIAPQALGISNSKFCQSLLDPNPSHALDWLKCLILTRHGDEDDSSGTQMDHRQRSHNHEVTRSRLGALSATTTKNQPQDFGPVGQAIARRTRTVHASQSASTNEFSTGSSSSTTTTATTAGSGIVGAGSRPQVLSGNNVSHHAESAGAGFGSENHTLSTSQSGHRHASAAAVVTVAIVSPAVSDSALASTTMPSDMVGSESMHHAMKSSSDLNPVAPPLPMTSTSGSISSNNATPASNSSLPSTSSPSPSTSTSSSSPSSSTSPTKTTNPTPSSILSSTSDKTTIILSQLTLEKIGQAVQNGMIYSKDATMAFFYRTFSPTYRVSQMYIDSWTNGQQRRGIERMQKSVVNGNAFALVKGATTHMKDVWNQVKAAYKVKAANAKREAARIQAAKEAKTNTAATAAKKDQKTMKDGAKNAGGSEKKPE